MEAPPTQRLWLTEPGRSTSLSTVTAVQGGAFALDRSLFAPTSRAHRHPQPHDTGTVWIQGEKRRLIAVQDRDGALWHRLRGAVPAVGARLQCQLDAARRHEVSRAHTALHLAIAALRAEGAPPMVADPAVKLGGTFRLELARAASPAVLAGAVQRVRAWIAENRKVESLFVPRGAESKLLDEQIFQPPDPYPGPATVLSAFRIEGVCTYPCDGTHAARTGLVGPFAFAEAHANRSGGFILVGRIG